jgi:PilZ domain
MRIERTRAALINVSPLGVQVLSPKALRPNQPVEIVIERYGVTLQTKAEIVWSSIELAGAAMTCRAGITFPDAHPELMKLETTAAAA